MQPDQTPTPAREPLLDLRHIETTVTLADIRAFAAAQPFAAGMLPVDPAGDLRICDATLADVDDDVRQVLAALGYRSEPQAADGGVLVRAQIDAPTSLAALRQIYARLRRPDGCPWDREQTPQSMLKPLQGEVQELAEALDAEDWPHVVEELGDVLGNVLMLAQIAEEAGHLQWSDVVDGVATKLVRRHPHVFAGEMAQSVDDIMAIWQRVKQEERADSGNAAAPSVDQSM